MYRLLILFAALLLLAAPAAAQTAVPVTPSAPRSYTVTTAARVRSCPSTSCTSIGSLRPGQTIRVTGSATGDRITGNNATWYALTLNDRRGYVYSGLVTRAGAAPAMQPAGGGGGSVISTPAPAPVSTPAPAPGFACNCARTCGQMTCQEAYFQLNQCGCQERDSDADGRPCEAQCGG
jgi:hypothetical protein